MHTEQTERVKISNNLQSCETDKNREKDIPRYMRGTQITAIKKVDTIRSAL